MDRYYITTEPSLVSPGSTLHLLNDAEQECGAYVDAFRTRSGAEHARTLLESGACTVDPHALVGCRVIPLAVVA